MTGNSEINQFGELPSYPEPLPPNPPGHRYPSTPRASIMDKLANGGAQRVGEKMGEYCARAVQIPEVGSARQNIEEKAADSYLKGDLNLKSALSIFSTEITLGAGRFLAHEPLRQMMSHIPKESGIRIALDKQIGEMSKNLETFPPEGKQSLIKLLNDEREGFIQEGRPEFGAVMEILQRVVNGSLDDEQKEFLRGLLLTYPAVKRMVERLDTGKPVEKVLMLPFIGNKKNNFVGARMMSTFVTLVELLQGKE